MAQQRDVGEAISKLAERVSAISASMHLFEEALKRMTSSLGRLSALMLIQSGLPIGHLAGMMGALRAVGGGGALGSGNPSARLSQMMGYGVPGSGPGQSSSRRGQALEAASGDLQELARLLMPHDAKEEMKNIGKVFRDVMRAANHSLSRQLADVMEENGLRGRGRKRSISFAEGTHAANLQAAAEKNKDNVLSFDAEWIAPLEEVVLDASGKPVIDPQTGKHMTRSVGPYVPLQFGGFAGGQAFHYDIPGGGVQPLPEQVEKYADVVTHSRTEVEQQLDKPDRRKFLQTMFQEVFGKLGVNLTGTLGGNDWTLSDADKERLKQTVLPTFSGKDDWKAISSLWAEAFGGVPGLEDIPLGRQRRFDVEAHPALADVRKKAPSMSLQSIFMTTMAMTGEDGPGMLADQMEKMKLAGFRTDDKIGKQYHQAALDAWMHEQVRSRYPKLAELMEKDASGELLSEAEATSTTTPSLPNRPPVRFSGGAYGLGRQAAMSFMGAAAVAQVVNPNPKNPNVKGLFEELAEARKPLPLVLAGHNELDEIRKQRVQELEAEIRSRLSEKNTGVRGGLGRLVDEADPQRAHEELKKALHDSPAAAGGSEAERKGSIGKSLLMAIPALQKFTIGVTHATGALGMVAKAGAPDAWGMLADAATLVVASFSDLLVPALVKTTETLVRFAGKVQEFTKSPAGKAVGSYGSHFAEGMGQNFFLNEGRVKGNFFTPRSYGVGIYELLQGGSPEERLDADRARQAAELKALGGPIRLSPGEVQAKQLASLEQQRSQLESQLAQIKPVDRPLGKYYASQSSSTGMSGLIEFEPAGATAAERKKNLESMRRSLHLDKDDKGVVKFDRGDAHYQYPNVTVTQARLQEFLRGSPYKHGTLTEADTSGAQSLRTRISELDKQILAKKSEVPIQDTPDFKKQIKEQLPFLGIYSARTTPQFTSVEDVYRKVQVESLSKSPIERLLDMIHTDTLKKMLEELSKSNTNLTEIKDKVGPTGARN